MNLEGLKEREEDGEGEFHHLWHTGHPILGESHTEVLLHGSDEHLLRSEGLGREKGVKHWGSKVAHLAGILQDGSDEFQTQNLGTEFVRPGISGMSLSLSPLSPPSPVVLDVTNPLH